MVDDQPIGASHGVPQGDAFMQDVDHDDGQGNIFSVEYGDQSSIITMLQNMENRQDERYEEDCWRQDAFEATQVERFCLIQEHMTIQDPNFEAFTSYVTKRLISMRNEMDANHVATIAKINHMIFTKNENHYHYAQLYR